MSFANAMTKATRRLAVIACAAVITLLAVCAAPSAAYADDVTLYRMYNRNTSEHLYTSDQNEVKTLYAMSIGWGYEGTCWMSPSTGTPVYRLFHAGLNAHVYTTDTNEVNVLTSQYDWAKDNGGKPVFYSAPKSSTAVSVYRLYNPSLHGLHHQTTDVNEYNALINYGWKQEGVAFYANAVGAPLKQTRFHPAVMDGDGPAEGYGWWTNSHGQTQFYENGQIVKGRFLVTKPDDPRAGLARYWFDNSGVLVQNRLISASECGWNCFATTNGAIAIHKTKWGNGILVADDKGELETRTGWVVSDKYDGRLERYYMDTVCNGMVGARTGYFEVDGHTYYGTDQGYVLRNTHVQKDGKWYSVNNDGQLAPLEPALSNMMSRAQGYSSANDWMLMVDCTNNWTGIFRGHQGNWTPYEFIRCSTGAPWSPTVIGEYSVTGRGYSFGTNVYTCYYYTQFYGDYLFHTIEYKAGTFEVLDGRIGENISAGCVRLPLEKAKWIYDNVPYSTKVVTYK